LLGATNVHYRPPFGFLSGYSRIVSMPTYSRMAL
jgi:hypothetical protein